MSLRADQYFSQVNKLLAGMSITGLDGGALELNAGTDAAVDLIVKTGRSERSGRKVILIGNGGSASIAGHMEMDLCNRAGIRALVFNDPPVLTALANDYGYEHAFERLISLWAESDDLLIAISSSGQSENILRGVRMAREHRCKLVTMSGFEPDNPLRATGDINFYIASSNYGEVEVSHHALGHFLTDAAVEQANSDRSSPIYRRSFDR